VGPGVGLPQIMAIVGGHQGQVELASQPGQSLVGDGLALEAVGLKFEIEIARAENFGIFQRYFPGTCFLVAQELGGNFPLEAARQGDQPPMVLPQELLIDSSLVVESFQVRQGHQLHQIPVTGQVFGEQDQMIVAVFIAIAAVIRLPLTIEAAPGGDVHLASQDGLDLGLSAELIEFQRPKHVAVVGYGHGRHLVAANRVDKVFQPYRPIQQAEFGVDVQVNKRCHRYLPHPLATWGL